MLERTQPQRQGNNLQKPWVLPRHRFGRNLAYVLLVPYTKWKYGVNIERFRAQGDRPYLILYNHQTPMDQFLVGASFRGPVYYLATEDIFSKGFVSKLLRWLVAPIPIMKSTGDLAAVKNCIRVAREGGTLAIAPEGNRTYSGKTEYMSPAIAGLAKKLKLPIALYRIEGGYGVQPRWSDCVRKGRMRAYVSRVIEPEHYEKQTNDELYEEIRAGLDVNEACPGGVFRSHRSAEYLERCIYVCPFCGLSGFESRGNIIRCTRCGRQIEYGEDKRLRGVGFKFPFDYAADWYDAQADYVSRLDLADYQSTPMFTDTAALYEVIVSKRKQLLRKQAELRLYGDRITIDEGTEYALLLPFSEITAAAVLGRNRLNLYHNRRVYQLRGGKRFNALKYVNIYYLHKKIDRGDGHGKFLGL